jgi:uncharacterized protein YbjT (DUF2867 family)
MKKIVAVAGATGNQGGAVARRLLEHGHRVRALTRQPEGSAARDLKESGAELLRVDFEDRASLAAAVDNVDAAFVMATPFEGGIDAEARQARNLVDAGVLAGVPHIVYSSVASADRSTGVPHFESKFEVEQHLRNSGVPYTVVAPVMFIDMLVAPWSLPTLRAGWLGAPVGPDTPVQRVAVADIGAFVALAIEQPERFIGRRVEIAGEISSGSEVAAGLSHHVGREIRYVQTPMEQAGGEDFVKMYEFLAGGGYQVDIAALRLDVPEIPWRDLDDWASGLDWASMLAENGMAS